MSLDPFELDIFFDDELMYIGSRSVSVCVQRFEKLKKEHYNFALPPSPVVSGPLLLFVRVARLWCKMRITIFSAQN